MKFDLQVKIHSGKLNLTISNGKHTFQAEYSETEVVETVQVDLGEKKGFFEVIAALFDFDPVTVNFQGLADNTIYSVRFTNSQVASP